MKTSVFTYDQVEQFCAFLGERVESRDQFSVTPHPQDLNAPRTGWCVSYPEPAAVVEDQGGAVA